MGGVFLNRCYANVHGYLVPVSDGEGQFGKTCSLDQCDLEVAWQFLGWLNCTCADGHGQNINTRTYLGKLYMMILTDLLCDTR